MGLLILAIVILSFSAFFGVYLAEVYIKLTSRQDDVSIWKGLSQIGEDELS